MCLAVVPVGLMIIIQLNQKEKFKFSGLTSSASVRSRDSEVQQINLALVRTKTDSQDHSGLTECWATPSLLLFLTLSRLISPPDSHTVSYLLYCCSGQKLTSCERSLVHS